MKAKDMRNRSEQELQKQLHDLQADLQKNTVEYRSKEIKNVKAIKNIKKDIARILTIQKEKQLQQQSKGAKQ